jgi:SAM-dependent methyltransferase
MPTQKMKQNLRRCVDCLPRWLADRVYSLYHRLVWQTKAGKLHEVYYRDYQSLSTIIERIRASVTASPRQSLRILELGCSGGNNLRLMREMIPLPIEYVGFDIQPKAIAFAREKFPNDTFWLGDDLQLLQQGSGLGRFDVFLASGVFSYIPEARCVAVLALSARLADRVLVCDDLSHWARPAGACDGIFQHPYHRMCNEAGLELVGEPLPSTGGHRYGVFEARPRNQISAPNARSLP